MSEDLQTVARALPRWASELGFDAVGITDTDLQEAEARLQTWLARGYHGTMAYMAAHGLKRSRPAELVPGTCRIISVRMNYWPARAREAGVTLADPQRAYVARYALGRDYHKVMRQRLKRLAARIETAVGPFGYRVFVDSAPVLEKPLAVKAGHGWIGKHTNVINPGHGSWFVLGEIYTDLPLPHSAPFETDHCGSCRRCLDVCPTGAIIGPYQLDARLCVSYLTIENQGPIPEELRPMIGNRVFGCDDCQLFCPWNRFARETGVEDFAPRRDLDAPSLVELFAWTPAQFDERTRGSPLRRAGYAGWLRNLAVALGNAPSEPAVIRALQERRSDPEPLVREHVGWALRRHGIE